MGVSPFQRPSLDELQDLVKTPLFIDRYGRSRYPIMGAADPDDSDEDEDADDEDLEDDEDGDDEDEPEKGKTKREDPRLKELRDENARRRRREKELKARAEAAEAKVAEHEGKDKTELDRTKDESGTWKTRAEAAESRSKDLALRNAFLLDNQHSWHNPRAALKLLDLSEVEIDEEDGEVTGMTEAIEKLAKDNPWLIKRGKSDEDDEDDDPPAATGSATKRKRRDPKAVNREKLMASYPALAGRV